MYHRPLWMMTTPRIGVDPFARLTWKAYNRSDAALVVGGIYMLDIPLTLRATTEPANSKGVILPPTANFKFQDFASALFAAIKPPAAANTNHIVWGALGLVAEAAVADNEEHEFLMVGRTRIASLLPAAAGAPTTYQPGAQFEFNPNTTTGIVRSNAGGLGQKALGFTLQDVVATVTPDPVLNVDVLFCGFGHRAS